MDANDVVATQWEYAIYNRSDERVAFYWSQGEGLISRAKEWFGGVLRESGSGQNSLSLKMGGQSDIFVIAFMGANGWEMIGFSNIGLGTWWFKRPYGNSEIAAT